MARGETVRGAWLSLPSVECAALLAGTPCDWLGVDMARSPAGVDVMARMVAAIARAGGPAPLVRVSTVEQAAQAVDAGAAGVVGPQVATAAQAGALVAATKFPPLGRRGYGSPYAGLTFGPSGPDYPGTVNERVLAMVEIGHADALPHLDEILSVPGVDGAYVASTDLAISMGLGANPDSDDADYVRALETVVESGKQHDLPVGIFCSSPASVQARPGQGFTLINVASDVGLLLQGMRARLT